MEILSICIHEKDGSLLDWYPSEYLDQDFDISIFENFCEWARNSATADGQIDLGCTSYQAAVELLGTDDLRCPSLLCIRFRMDVKDYTLSIAFNRKTYTAYLYDCEDDDKARR